MNNQRAIELLTKQHGNSPAFHGYGAEKNDFQKWRRDTEVVIRKIFGDDSSQAKEFKRIPFLDFSSSKNGDFNVDSKSIDRAKTLLLSMIYEITQFGLGEQEIDNQIGALSLIEKICLRFHSVARQLQARHDNRETLTVTDEYDVQDLLHALLRIHFVDIRQEEWTPSFAGAASRLDFLLKDEQIVIEVKKTRASLKAADVGKELAVDIARYRSHPDCSCLVCFVYDPNGYLGNPKGLERDLETLATSELKIRVIIAPRES